jgi:hypothetical protein
VNNRRLQMSSPAELVFCDIASHCHAPGKLQNPATAASNNTPNFIYDRNRAR